MVVLIKPPVPDKAFVMFNTLVLGAFKLTVRSPFAVWGILKLITTEVMTPFAGIPETLIVLDTPPVRLSGIGTLPPVEGTGPTVNLFTFAFTEIKD